MSKTYTELAQEDDSGLGWDIGDPDDPGFTVHITRPEKNWVTLGPRHALPRTFFATWNHPPHPICEMQFVTEADGEVWCGSFELRTQPNARRDVTVSTIRSIRIAELKRRAIRLATLELRFAEDGTPFFLHPKFGDEPATLPKEFQERIAHKPQRGKRLPDQRLQEVAQVYRDALKNKQPPTQAVAKHFYTARSNAGRWVAEARKRGFLGDAVSGQPGEIKKPKGGTTRGKR